MVKLMIVKRWFSNLFASGLLMRFMRFGLVGASGALVDMGILFCLTDPSTLHWELNLGKAIAAEIAMFNNFIWNDMWTFGDCRRSGFTDRWLQRFGKFNLICLTGLGLNLLLLNFQVYWLHWNVYLSNLIAIFLVSLWNFLINRRYNWTGCAGRPNKNVSAPVRIDAKPIE